MVEYEDLNLFHVSLKLMLLHYIIQSQCSTRRKTNQGSFKVLLLTSNYKLIYLRTALKILVTIQQINILSRKEVFQPHLPVRLPCYDLAPVTCITLGRPLRLRTLGTPDSHGLTGGVYKARERIHRAMADARLLANPASRSRVADSNPN